MLDEIINQESCANIKSNYEQRRTCPLAKNGKL